jgi:hypothetical protein
MNSLKTARGIHSETLLTVIGAINGFLFPEEGSVLPLAALNFGPAVKAGVAEADLPNLGNMASHVATVVGSAAEFGKLRVRPGVEPHCQPLAALNKFWPDTRDMLARPPVKPLFGRREGSLQEIHRPMVLGVVASQCIAMTKQTLNPSIGAAIVMESAVITSKIDPQRVEPGKWRIDTSNRRQPVVRLRS